MVVGLAFVFARHLAHQDLSSFVMVVAVLCSRWLRFRQPCLSGMDEAVGVAVVGVIVGQFVVAVDVTSE